MEKALTPKERSHLIRKGNEIFNNGDIDKAAKIYTTTAYKDGLIRVGDYYYFDKKDIFKAQHYYFEAKYEKRINEISARIALVIKKWLSDKPQTHSPEQGKKQG